MYRTNQLTDRQTDRQTDSVANLLYRFSKTHKCQREVKNVKDIKIANIQKGLLRSGNLQSIHAISSDKLLLFRFKLAIPPYNL